MRPVRGVRVHGSTRCPNKRQAQEIEKAERAKAKENFRDDRRALRLTIDAATGQHHACSAETWANLERLVGYFGKDKLLDQITDDDLARLVAWRRGHQRWGRKGQPLIAPATVNRSTTEVLQKLFCHARSTWKLRFDGEPDWGRHMLREPQERVRELRADDAERLDETVRADYEPFLSFARASDQRFKECLLLKWSEVNWTELVITTRGKGGRTITIPITPTIASVLWPLRGHHPERVFTYVAQRTRVGRVKGQRYPMTVGGAKSSGVGFATRRALRTSASTTSGMTWGRSCSATPVISSSCSGHSTTPTSRRRHATPTSSTKRWLMRWSKYKSREVHRAGRLKRKEF